MPGEIGASMFSPRPGRGYRFHSLQVEIIARTFAISEMRQFWLIEPANEQFLCWNLNALLQKIGDGNHGEITISWMVKAVTDGGGRPPRIVARCCSWVRSTLGHHWAPSLPITRSRHCPPPSAVACRIGAAGGRSTHFHKKQGGRRPCKAKPRSIRFCVRNARQ